jgi:hypothetical protein
MLINDQILTHPRSLSARGAQKRMAIKEKK